MIKNYKIKCPCCGKDFEVLVEDDGEESPIVFLIEDLDELQKVLEENGIEFG